MAMLPKLASTSAVSKNDSAIFLVKEGKQVPSAHFTDEERKYINAQLNDKKNFVTINQYKRVCMVYKPEDKKDPFLVLEACRKNGETAAAALNRQKKTTVTIIDEAGTKAVALAFAEGMMLGNYQFIKYKNNGNKDKNTLTEIHIKSAFADDDALKNTSAMCDGVYHARDLVNEPQNAQTATQLASAFVKMGREAGFKTEVFNKARIKALKMGGLLAVNLGSVEPPTFTVMEWKPRNPKNKKPIVLVGKGVVYDTGGLSLKPTPNSMDYMKCDMGGAAAVGCAMYAIAKAKLPVHVIALVPSTDNRPSGNAYAPGDVITMMSGNTVEVLNTDAEGRMILADALHYAKRYKPELVMDFATLTGAASAAVGPFGMVCMGTADEKTKNKMKVAGNNVYERLAEFPFWDEYDDLIKSDVAEMKNIGGPVAGAITAGKFLQRYIDYPWMHFDIAGPAFLHTASSYRGKGGTGYGVRFLFNYLQNI
ncbi:leucyl aminopeptidase [soil metagenome]